MSQEIIQKKVDVYINNNGSSDLIEQLQQFLKDEIICDVTLTAANGGMQLKAHRLILAARSDYFLRMFTGSFKEAESKEVNFENIDGKTLEMVIKYIYSSEIQLESDTVENILRAANFLQIKPLEEACSDFLRKEINTCNGLGILFLAEQLEMTQLWDFAFEFALKHFMELRRNKEFFSLNVDLLSKLISHDNLQVYSEEEVFHAILSWVDHDREKRQEFLGQLFWHLRLTMLPSEFVADVVEPTVKSSACKELINKSYKLHCLPKLRSSAPEQQIKRRTLNDALIAIDGFDIAGRNLRVAFYLSALKEWFYTECPNLPEPRSHFGSFVLDGKVYIAGGIVGNREVTNRVDCLDLKTFQWSQLPPLLTGRSSCGMTMLNDQLYVVGGKSTAGGVLNSVEKWEPHKEKWENIAVMGYGISSPYVGVKGSFLCVADVRSQTETVFDYYQPVNGGLHNPRFRHALPLCGMKTISINKVDHFCLIYKTEIISYDIKTNAAKMLKLDSMDDSFCTDLASSYGSFITYNEGCFKEYCRDRKEWEAMPNLEKSDSEELLLHPSGMLFSF